MITKDHIIPTADGKLTARISDLGGRFLSRFSTDLGNGGDLIESKVEREGRKILSVTYHQTFATGDRWGIASSLEIKILA